jgi:hypothetical protein
MSASLSHLLLSLIEKVSHLVIDSIELKVFGEKEWLETKQGSFWRNSAVM